MFQPFGEYLTANLSTFVAILFSVSVNPIKLLILISNVWGITELDKQMVTTDRHKSTKFENVNMNTAADAVPSCEN